MNKLPSKSEEIVTLLCQQQVAIEIERYDLSIYNEDLCSDCSNHYCQHMACQEGVAYNRKIDKILKDLQATIKQAQEEIKRLNPKDYSLPT